MFVKAENFNLVAGEPYTVNIPATFFQLMAADSGLDIEVLRNSSVMGRMLGVPAGVSFGPFNDGEEFHAVRFTSAIDQTIKAVFARGAVDLKSVVGTVGVTGIVDTSPSVRTISSDFYTRYSQAITANTIVAAAANVNGIRIDQAAIVVAVAATGYAARVSYGPAAPSVWYDTTHGTVIAIQGSSQYGQRAQNLNDMPLIIPAGYGLYEMASSSAVNTLIGVAYEVL